MDIPESQPEKRIKELIAVALFRDGRISSGKGAELLSITKLDFILLLSQYGVTYFTDSPDELVSEVASIERLLKKTNS